MLFGAGTVIGATAVLWLLRWLGPGQRPFTWHLGVMAAAGAEGRAEWAPGAVW
jgi:hypothetical protein